MDSQELVIHTERLEVRMQNWIWIVIGLTSGGLVVGTLVILMAIAASRTAS